MPARSSTKRREARSRAAKRKAIWEYMRACGEVPIPGNANELLTICAEMRNRIYEEVLLVDAEITVTPELREPALLSVCRKVRAETRNMWLCRNRFVAPVVDCDARLAEKWYSSLWIATARHTPFTFIYQFRGKRNWSNLMRWCKVMYDLQEKPLLVDDKQERHSMAKISSDTMNVSTITVAAAVVCLVSRGRFDDWNTCEEALRTVRMLAGEINRDWLIDYEQE